MKTPLCFHPLRLTHYDRAMLFGGGVLSFRPGSAPVDLDTNPSKYRPKGRTPEYGAVRDLAARVVAGEYAGLSFGEICDAEKERRKSVGLPEIALSDDSLKNTVWKLRNKWKERPRRLQARRAAA